MSNRLRFAVLGALAAALTVAVLIPALREGRSDLGPPAFVLPSQQPLTLTDYVTRLATTQAPSKNARPDGYVFMVGFPRIAFYWLGSTSRSAAAPQPKPRG